MKTPFTLFCLFLYSCLWSQSTINRAIDIAARKDTLSWPELPVLTNVYEQEELITQATAVQLIELQRFVRDPFDNTIVFGKLQPRAVRNLSIAIKDVQERKARIDEDHYQLLLNCRPDFPATYTDFMGNLAAVVRDEDLDCYETNLRAMEDEEELAEFIDSMEELPITVSAGMPTTPPPDAVAIAPTTAPSAPLDLTTKIIDASAQFLVDRVQEELLLAFFDRFLTRVDESPELRQLMPNTLILLRNQDIFKVPTMGKAWVAAFKEDIGGFTDNLEHLIEREPAYLALQEELPFQLFTLANFTYRQVNADEEVWDIFENMHDRFGGQDTELSQHLDFLYAMTQNLRNTAGDFERAHFNKLLRSEDTAQLYFSALVYQRNQSLFEKIKLDVNGDLLQLVAVVKSYYPLLIEQAGRFYELWEEADLAYDELDDAIQLRDAYPTNKSSETKYKQALLDQIESIFDLVDYSFDLLGFYDSNSKLRRRYFELYQPLSRSTLRTVEAALDKDYGLTLLYALQTLQPITDARLTQLDTKLSAGGLDKKTKKRLKQERQILKAVVRNLAFYGGFMVDILSASSTPEIKSIIQKYAAPVGSYRVKRQSQFSVSLSAYPGLYAGSEGYQLFGPHQAFVSGVTAPIGISFNWGDRLLFWKQKNHSFSFFIPVIDIGAPFSYRWSNDANEGFPTEIEWEQILSPGFYGVWGIGKTPLALMVGAQYTPQLRDLNNAEGDLQPNAWRFGATLAVDIPFTHFYRKGKDGD